MKGGNLGWIMYISMKQKIISLAALFLFFSVFWYFYGESYWDFQKNQKNEKIFYAENAKSIEHFSLQDLPVFWDDISLHMTPDLKFLDTLVSQIDAAQEKIYAEVYIFTEKKMWEALVRAHQRGVEVKVLLENNPYQAPSLNDETFDILQSAGIDVRWSDPLLYSLNHSKLLLIDDRAYISTGNFSYSLFAHNKDFLLELRQKDILSKLQELFLLDFEHKLWWVFSENLVVSPYNSREKLEYLLKSAGESIDFYFPYLQDEWLESILFEAAKNGIHIRGIVDQSFYDENPEMIQKYREWWILLSPLKKQKLHAKMILVDETYMYLGSINFSRYSMDENRELGIILRDMSLIKKMKEIFQDDF